MRDFLLTIAARLFRRVWRCVGRVAGGLLLTVSMAAAQAPAAVGGANAEITKWLTQTGAQFDAAYQRDVQAPFEAGLATLRKNYLAAVMKAMETAAEARKLDEANLFRAERERFLGAGHKVPDNDSDNPSDAIKVLRSTFRAPFAQIDLERFTRAKALHSRCDQSLAQMELALTQRQRSADAVLVKAKRDDLAKAWLQPPAQSPGEARAGVTSKAPAPPRTEVTKETIRAAVEWVFSVGGTVALPDGKDGRGERDISDVSQLPSGAVTIARIVLDSAKLTKPVQDGDIAPLAGLRSVRFFDFRGVKLTDAAFSFFDGWKDLEKFHLNGSRVNDDFVARLVRFEKLHSIQLRNAPEVTGKTFDKLAALKNLHSLDLNNCKVSDEGLAAISQLKGLDELLILGTEVSNAGMVHLATMHNLRRLQIQGTQVTATGLTPLATLKDVEELGFLSPGMTDYAGAVKQVGMTWPKLKSLRFMGGDVRAEHLEPLVALRSLKELHFQNIDLGEPAIAAIEKLTGVEELSITFVPFSDDKITALTALKKVRVLRLNNTKVTNAGILKFKTMKGLKELEVRVTPVTGAGVAALEKELPGCRVLR